MTRNPAFVAAFFAAMIITACFTRERRGSRQTAGYWIWKIERRTCRLPVVGCHGDDTTTGLGLVRVVRVGVDVESVRAAR